MDNIILKIVAEAYGLTVSDILCKSKQGKRPEAARMVTLLLNKPKEKPSKIAYSINRERTAVYHNIKKITFEIKHYKDVQEKFKTVKMSFTNYLEKTKTELESWLINNPCQDQKIREEKLERLAEVEETQEYITNLKIN
jgi:hypothetical protein